jgi:hypothetical protein
MHIDPTRLRPMPPFILIKIYKDAQRFRKEKIGSLYYPPAYVFMKRNCQAGEIVKIGKWSKKEFPEAKIGDALICHHLVENHDKSFFIYSDDVFNYYLVTTVYFNGDRNLTFGIWDGQKLIPNKDYIFLEPVPEPESEMPDFDINAPGLGRVVTNMPFKQAANGIVTIKPRKLTREDLSAKMKSNILEIKKLSRWLPIMREKIAPMIMALEQENERLSKEINTVVCESHIVAACNPEFSRDHNVHPGDSIFILNIACYMTVEFMGKEYVIAESKYIHGHPNTGLE